MAILVVIGTAIPSDSYTPSVGSKSINRNDSYIDDGSDQALQKTFHLSFDDTIALFEDLTKNADTYDSIFDNATLAWFRELHDEYETDISCYVFYEDGDFNLDQVPSKYKGEFESNADWLRFGFHGINAQTIYNKDDTEISDDYERTIHALENIVGSEAIDNVVRLSSFQGSKSDLEELSQESVQPIVGFLTADDNRQSYYLDEEDNKYIYSHDYYYDKEAEISFISTDLRLEFVDNVNSKLREFNECSWYNQLSYLEVFSHEWEIDYSLKQKTKKLCEYAADNGYTNAFWEDVLNDASKDSG